MVLMSINTEKDVSNDVSNDVSKEVSNDVPDEVKDNGITLIITDILNNIITNITNNIKEDIEEDIKVDVDDIKEDINENINENINDDINDDLLKTNPPLLRYATKSYREFIDLEKAKILIKFWDEIINILPDHRKDSIYENINKKGFIDPLLNLKKMVQECYNKVVSYPFGYITTTYKPSKYDVYSNTDYTGRLFCHNASLQNIPREIRGTLSSGAYLDIDIVNAHPVFLSQYCKKNGIDCVNLNKYVIDREFVIEEVAKDCSIDKGGVKRLILKCINGGNIGNVSSQFLNDFYDEVKQIHDKISKIPENKPILSLIKRRKDNNHLGSLMNNILCRIENNILLHTVHFLTIKGFDVGVLVFDGLMIKKTDDFNEDMIVDLSKYISYKTEYNVKFTIKPMEVLDLEPFEKRLRDDYKEVKIYKNDKVEWEKNHMKIMYPPCYLTLRSEYKINLQKKCDFLECNSHKKTNEEDVQNVNGEIVKSFKEIDLVPKWFKDKHIKVFDHIDFIPPPLTIEDDVFNMFRGFKIKDIINPPEYDINIINHINKYHSNIYINKYLHLCNAIFDNDDKLINFYLSFCANKLQRPGDRAKTCIVFFSEEKGVGKNRLLDTFNKILDETYYTELESAKKQLYNDHSTVEEGKLLLILNEAKNIDNLENADILRSRITTDTLLVNPKNVNPYNIKNLCDYVMTTNNERVVDMDDTERRFLIVECGASLMQNEPFFTDYTAEVVNNPTALRCIYDYLMNWDILKHIPSYQFQNARPITNFQKMAIHNNRPREWLFLEYIVYEYCKNDFNTLKFKSGEMWGLYVSYCERNNFKINHMTSMKFSAIFNKKIIKTIDKKEDYNGIVSYIKSHGIRYIKIDKLRLLDYFKMYNPKTDEDIEDDEDI